MILHKAMNLNFTITSSVAAISELIYINIYILLCPVFAPIGIYSIYKCTNGANFKTHPEIQLQMGFAPPPFNKDEGFI